MKISLVHATRRPVEGKKCQQLWLDSAENRANVEIVTAVDADDLASQEAFPDAVVVSGSEGCVAPYNAAAKLATGDILFQLDDDFRPAKGWDQIVESYMCNGADILHVGDKHRKDDLICHVVISRRYYETMGFFMCPNFKSVYVDNMHTVLAKNWGYVDASEGGMVDIGFLHASPSQGYGPEDEVARISNSPERYAHGKAVFDRLCNDQLVLAFTACDRPHFLKESLSSWLKTNLKLVTSVQFFIEPTDKLPEIHAVIDEFEASCPVPVIRHVNPEKYGVLRNPWELFHNLFDFQLADQVILGEDDFIVSPDTLNFFEATRKKMDAHTMAVCAKWVGGESNEDPSQWHRVKEFSGNIWLTSRQIWKKYLKETWDFDYSSGKEDGTPSGWDWNFSLRVMPRNDLHCIVPTASRSYHVGVVGVHSTEEEYAATTTPNFIKQPYIGSYSELGTTFIREAACSSAGDCGDIFVSLATLKHSGFKTHYYLRDTGGTKGIVGRAHLVIPLLESQPYIASVKIWEDEPVEWASEGFRGGWVQRTKMLAECHAQHAVDTGFVPSLPDFSKPWLKVEPDKDYAGRIIVNRSERYNNSYFPWREIVAHYGKLLLFVGMPHEHRIFCDSFGEVEYKPTKDFLEVARMIAGSELIIANQSACMAIAEGLKHPRIQEGSLHIPDCVYPLSDNAQYVFDGQVNLPDIDGSGTLEIPSQAVRWQDFDINIVPKVGANWGWHYKHGDVMIIESIVSVAARKLRKLTGWDLDKCSEEVVRYTVNLAPNFFAGRINFSQFDACKRAVLHAGLKDHPILSIGMGKMKAP